MLLRARHIVLASSSVALALGCSTAGDEEATIEIAIPPYEVPLGAEMVRCHEMAMPSDEDVDVVRLTSRFSEGMHHVHIYTSAGGATGAPEVTYDCPDPVSFEDWHLLVAVQMEGLDWMLPEGTAIRVNAGQSILVQTHWLNTGAGGPQAEVARGGVTLGLARPGSVTRRAAAIVGQNLDIDVPPHTSGRVEGECALPGQGHLLAAMGHYHLHGKRFEAWIQPAGDPPAVFYESEGSSEPPWVTYDDLHLGEGARLAWSCDYENNLDTPLQTGPLASAQEHCSLFAFHTLDVGDASFIPCVIAAE